MPATQLTEGNVNCRWWRLRGGDIKIGYVMGWIDAAVSSDNKLLLTGISTEITYGEYVRGIDALCAVPENGPIPALVMIGVFTRKFQGAPEATINAELEADRKFYSQTVPVPPPPQKTGGKQQ
jgi:hypothetical protein